jgi:hypothetical protein
MKWWLMIAVLMTACSSGDPSFTVHLRCSEPPAGALSLERLAESGETMGRRTVDVRSACGAGKIELDDYSSTQSLRVVLARDGGQTVGEATARYGPNIQRDQHGFFTVFRITGRAPFVQNDSI